MVQQHMLRSCPMHGRMLCGVSQRKTEETIVHHHFEYQGPIQKCVGKYGTTYLAGTEGACLPLCQGGGHIASHSRSRLAWHQQQIHPLPAQPAPAPSIASLKLRSPPAIKAAASRDTLWVVLLRVYTSPRNCVTSTFCQK